MEYKIIDWITPSRGGHSSGPNASGVRIANAIHSTKKGKEQRQTTIRLGTDVMKACNFLLGDKVVFARAQTDKGPAIAIKRVNDGGGYALSNPRIKEYRGTNKSWGVAKMACVDLPEGQAPLSKCRIYNDMLFVPVGELQ